MSALPASAVKIDFERLGNTGADNLIQALLPGEETFRSGQYTEDGFTLRALGGFSSDPLATNAHNQFSEPGSDPTLVTSAFIFAGEAGNNAQLFNDTAGDHAADVDGVTELTKSDGGLFDILSIKLAPLAANTGATVTFLGFKDDGDNVADVSKVFTFTFSAFDLIFFEFLDTDDFDQLKAVTWLNGTGSLHQFDDIVVVESQQTGGGGNNGGGTDIPEPGGLALLATGLLGLGLIARRRRHKL